MLIIEFSNFYCQLIIASCIRKAKISSSLTMIWSKRVMSNNFAASFNFFVSSSSARLGCRLPEGWLWQRMMLTASSSMAFFKMIRGSATVPVIPPSLMISKWLMRLAWFKYYGKHLVGLVAEQGLQVVGNVPAAFDNRVYPGKGWPAGGGPVQGPRRCNGLCFAYSF